MTNENQTENIHWSSRLNELENLPGEGFADKNASWNKLQHRMQEEPRRKMMWYWMAAACLLLLVLTPWLLQNKEPAVVKNNPRPKTIPSTAITPIKEQTAIIISKDLPEPATQTSNAALLVKDKNKNSGKKTLLKNDTSTAKKDELIIKQPAIAQSNSANIDTAVAIAPKIIATKKLRVVHLNELETSPALNVGEMVTSPSNQSNNKFKFNFLRSSAQSDAGDNSNHDESSLKIFINN